MSPIFRLALEIFHDSGTAGFAQRLAPVLGRGDVLALSGPIGAGKSTLAREIIRSHGIAEHIPSPTFTLVQTYAAGDLEIWHADLYRLAGSEEIWELGLEEAFDSGLCLIEWPDRLGDALPDRALSIELAEGAQPESRRVVLTGLARHWSDRLAAAGIAEDGAAEGLERKIQLFLVGTPWAGSQAEPLTGDASARRYFRLNGPEGTAILMLDTNPGGIDAFAALARHLREAGLSAPDVLAQDSDEGLLLTEDLGDDILARRIAASPEDEAELYTHCADTLAGLQKVAPPAGLAAPDAATLAGLTAPLAEWYVTDGNDGLGAMVAEALEPHLAAVLDDLPAVLCHRDFHAENLVWLPDRQGAARIGLLDFQDAFLGPPVYDLVSLVEDARRDLGPGVREAASEHFSGCTGISRQMCGRHMAVLGAQRNLRILGVFARLSRRMGKPRYVDLIPRVWSHLAHDLSHPDLADLRAIVQNRVAAPEPGHLERLRQP